MHATFGQTVEIMAKGMVSIFVVTGVIVLAIFLLNKIQDKSKD